MSSSVQVGSVSQLGGCVMETTTVETIPMNRTVACIILYDIIAENYRLKQITFIVRITVVASHN